MTLGKVQRQNAANPLLLHVAVATMAAYVAVKCHAESLAFPSPVASPYRQRLIVGSNATLPLGMQRSTSSATIGACARGKRSLLRQVYCRVEARDWVPGRTYPGLWRRYDKPSAKPVANVMSQSPGALIILRWREINPAVGTGCLGRTRHLWAG